MSKEFEVKESCVQIFDAEIQNHCCKMKIKIDHIKFLKPFTISTPKNYVPAKSMLLNNKISNKKFIKNTLNK